MVTPGTTGGLLRNPLLLVIVGAALVFAIIVIVQQAALAGRSTVASGPAATQDSAKGPADAKVTVEVYSDFQCPHCKTFVQSVEQPLVQEYVETGKVRYDYKHFIVISRESADAANASECAAEQGFFWPYHDLLFEQQLAQGRDTVGKPNLKAFGGRIAGLNASQFNACVESDEYIEMVYREMQQGTDAGVTGTPSVFVNGKKVDNWQSYEQIKAAIEAALAG